jgi:hypothetical protein
MVGETEGVVAGGSGDDTALLLVLRQAQQRIACAALLERAGALQVVEFAEDPRASDFGERDRFGTGGDDYAAGDAAAGGTDSGEGDGRGVDDAINLRFG